ncbi:hypothetical protein BUALT_Bualt07G0048500 [Buddleja alternifolia]|uniref:Gag-pol polyprotein n=1 Tax=Buddleja alternifolia TaxID=168488 RepID=A0AAV6XCK6_9LAMI|nr:hypothetical protein BUALT_Bualt07G0048500 [Buddleja alternifolia]
MAESTRSKDVHDTLKRQEALLLEERSMRQNSEHHFHSKFETMAALQIELQQSVTAMQTQLHSLAEQMHAYHKNKYETTIEAIIQRASSLHKSRVFPKPSFKPTPSSYAPLTRAPVIPSKPPFNPHRKLLTASEMRARREKNLCYNCDEVFVPGHRCKQRQVYMIMTQEKEEAYSLDIEDIDTSIDSPHSEDMTISINAISGNTNINTLRIKGLVKNSSIHILIDSGSTHCFLDETVANQLGCTMEITNPMLISVADGNKIVSRTFCPNFSWEIQGTKFTSYENYQAWRM